MGETRINDYRKTLSDFFTKNMHCGTKFAIKAPPSPKSIQRTTSCYLDDYPVSYSFLHTLSVPLSCIPLKTLHMSLFKTPFMSAFMRCHMVSRLMSGLHDHEYVVPL